MRYIVTLYTFKGLIVYIVKPINQEWDVRKNSLTCIENMIFVPCTFMYMDPRLLDSNKNDCDCALMGVEMYCAYLWPNFASFAIVTCL